MKALNWSLSIDHPPLLGNGEPTDSGYLHYQVGYGEYQACSSCGTNVKTFSGGTKGEIPEGEALANAIYLVFERQRKRQL